MPDTTLFQSVARFFADDGWVTVQLEGQAVLQMAFQGSSTQWMCFAQVREDAHQVVFYSVSPVTVPFPKRLAVAEYVTRANYGLILGNFELDFHDGELRYKTSLDAEALDGEARAAIPELIRALVYANVTTMDRYLPGLMEVIFSNAQPADVVERIEVAE